MEDRPAERVAAEIGAIGLDQMLLGRRGGGKGDRRIDLAMERRHWLHVAAQKIEAAIDGDPEVGVLSLPVSCDSSVQRQHQRVLYVIPGGRSTREELVISAIALCREMGQ